MPISATGRLISGRRGRAAIAYCCHVRNGTAITGPCYFMNGIHLWLMSLPEKLPQQSIPETDKELLLRYNLYLPKGKEKPAMPSRLKQELFYNMCNKGKENVVWKTIGSKVPI